MYVITGASGKVGGGIAEKLLAEGKQVKLIARHKNKLEALAKRGAQIAEGNMDDTSFLAKQFAGAEAVFVLTPPNLQAEDINAYQDRIGESAAKAIKESGVKYVVHLSSIGADKPKGNGPIAGLYRMEQRLNALPGVNVLHLRPAYFMENHLNGIPVIMQAGVYGSPMSADLKFPQIATRDIAAYAANRLLKKDFSGKQVQDLMGPREASMNEATAIFGKAIGKPDLRYVQFPYEDALKGMMGAGISRSMAESFIEMNKAFNEQTVTRPARNAANTTSTTLEDFAPTFAAAFKAGPGAGGH